MKAVANVGSLDKVTSEAAADVGSGQGFANTGQTSFAYATALPNAAYLAGLVPSPSHVYEDLIAPAHATVLSAGIVGVNSGETGEGTGDQLDQIAFDFASNPNGPLYLGLIQGFTDFLPGGGFEGMDFDVDVNGTQVFDFSTDCSTDSNCLADTMNFFTDDVIDLGSASGSGLDILVSYDVTTDGPGDLGGDFIIGTIAEPASVTPLLTAGLLALAWRSGRSATKHRRAAPGGAATKRTQLRAMS